jgi:hypothetical protein
MGFAKPLGACHEATVPFEVRTFPATAVPLATCEAESEKVVPTETRLVSEVSVLLLVAVMFAAVPAVEAYVAVPAVAAVADEEAKVAVPAVAALPIATQVNVLLTDTHVSVCDDVQLAGNIGQVIAEPLRALSAVCVAYVALAAAVVRKFVGPPTELVSPRSKATWFGVCSS